MVPLSRYLSACVFLLSLSSLNAQPPYSLGVGLWGAETRFGLPVAGTLTIDGRAPTWQASIAGYQVPVTVAGTSVTLALPGEAGRFRGQKDPKTGTISGHWMQPGGVILNNHYATPIDLRKTAAPNVWQGVVHPLEDRISLYLQISNGPSGLTATVTNPEGNFFRRRVYTIRQSGDRNVTLEARGQRFEGSFDTQSGNLTIPLVNWLPPFRFTPRRTPDEAPGFHPRTPAATPWTYRQPLPDLDDGWITSTLQAQGLKQAPLAALLRKILEESDPADTAWHIQSLTIARHGRLVLDEYFRGFSPGRPHDTRSAGKTIAPILAGIATQNGSRLTAATPVYPLFRQYANFANWDARKPKVTLRDIMTMTAGNACDDNDDESPGNEDRMQGAPENQDWYKYTLDLPMLRDPGGNQAIYCSGDLNLVGGAVAAATNAWLPQFFHQHLAKPLQFGRYHLNLMPDGQAYFGGGAYLRSRDLLKLGQLYLDGGKWKGRQIVSKEWVTASTTAHSRFADDRSLGQKHEYGYGWHIHSLRSGTQDFRVYAAEGNGGQLVVVIPDLDMVIGITGGAYGEFGQWYRWLLDLVPRYLIPAALP